MPGGRRHQPGGRSAKTACCKPRVTSYSSRCRCRTISRGCAGARLQPSISRRRDYHRVHLPVAGRLVVGRTAIPGELFSVNAKTEAAVSDLFCRNERLVCQFETAHGSMLVVLVGALIVASIETVWPGPRSPTGQGVTVTEHDLTFERGAEIGRFLLGSTVIVCFGRGGSTSIGDLVGRARCAWAAALGHALRRLTRRGRRGTASPRQWRAAPSRSISSRSSASAAPVAIRASPPPARRGTLVELGHRFSVPQRASCGQSRVSPRAAW